MFSTNSADHFQWLTCQNMEVEKGCSWDLVRTAILISPLEDNAIKPHPPDRIQLQSVHYVIFSMPPLCILHVHTRSQITTQLTEKEFWN